MSRTASADAGSTLDVSVLRAVIAMQHELAAVGLDLKAVMQRIADCTRELTGGTSAAVRLLEGDALVCGGDERRAGHRQSPPPSRSGTTCPGMPCAAAAR